METGLLPAPHAAALSPIPISLSVMLSDVTSSQTRQGLFSSVLCLPGDRCLLSVTLTSYCDACRALWAACLRPLCLGL